MDSSINSLNSLSLEKVEKLYKNDKYVPPKGKALPFVIYENGIFQIPKESEELLKDKNLKNIGIMSLVGKYRTGKSFLFNKILLNQNEKNTKNEKGFTVGPTIKPCTKGIWIWSEPLIIKNDNFNES